MQNILQLLTNLWRFRQFIVSSIRAEFAVRLARSKIGLAWTILNPLLQSAVLAFVLSGLLALRLPNQDGISSYALYLLAGMAAWSPCTELLTRSLNIFIDCIPSAFMRHFETNRK